MVSVNQLDEVRMGALILGGTLLIVGILIGISLGAYVRARLARQRDDARRQVVDLHLQLNARGR